MRTTAVGILLLLAPGAVAHADCRSAPECMAQLGIGRVDPTVAAVTGAAAAGVLATGAALTALRHDHEQKAPPTGVVPSPDPKRPRRATLALVPTVNNAPAPAGAEQAFARPSGAFELNEIVTDSAIAVGGAAILTSIIVGALHR